MYIIYNIKVIGISTNIPLQFFHSIPQQLNDILYLKINNNKMKYESIITMIYNLLEN